LHDIKINLKNLIYRNNEYKNDFLHHFKARNSSSHLSVDELDVDKLTPLPKLGYNNALNDAMADLGDAVQVRKAFVGFQRYMYSNSKSNKNPGDKYGASEDT